MVFEMDSRRMQIDVMLLTASRSPGGSAHAGRQMTDAGKQMTQLPSSSPRNLTDAINCYGLQIGIVALIYVQCDAYVCRIIE